MAARTLQCCPDSRTQDLLHDGALLTGVAHADLPSPGAWINELATDGRLWMPKNTLVRGVFGEVLHSAGGLTLPDLRASSAVAAPAALPRGEHSGQLPSLKRTRLAEVQAFKSAPRVRRSLGPGDTLPAAGRKTARLAAHDEVIGRQQHARASDTAAAATSAGVRAAGAAAVRGEPGRSKPGAGRSVAHGARESAFQASDAVKARQAAVAHSPRRTLECDASKRRRPLDVPPRSPLSLLWSQNQPAAKSPAPWQLLGRAAPST